MVDFDSGREERLSAHLLTGGVASGGITVRDYFAAKAMQSLSAVLWKKFHDDELDCFDGEHVADYSYWLADEMMKARDAQLTERCSVEEAFGL